MIVCVIYRAVRQTTSWNSIMWILRLRVSQSVQQIQRKLATAQEIKRLVAEGELRP
jgi:hypothetical protein